MSVFPHIKKFLTVTPQWVDILALIILNIGILSGIPIMSDVFGLLFLLILPGVLLLRILNFYPETIWERILHIVSLSIAILLIGGLIENTLLPLFGIWKPLEKIPLLIFFDILFIIFIIIGTLLGRRIHIFSPKKIHFQPHQVWLQALAFLLPLSAIGGATILNNGGSNFLAIATLLGIAGFLLYAGIRITSQNETFILTWVYAVSFALLLGMSMRSLHVVGWDINNELQVFRMTHGSAFWSMSHLQDAYNACLSITILPTIFLRFTHFVDEYIFKFLFQAIFALMPIGLYYFIKELTGQRKAILATTMFLGSAVFSHGMPTLIRQEFGFLFFSLILFIIFSEKIKSKNRNVLLVLYGTSMILSHYSTTYVALFLLGITFLLNSILRILKRFSPPTTLGEISHSISMWFLIFLAGVAFIWSGVITKTGNNITGFIDHSQSNISEVFSYDTVARSINQLFFPYPHFEDVNTYVTRESLNFKKNHSDFHFYSENKFSEEHISRMDFLETQRYLGDVPHVFTKQLSVFFKLFLNNIFVIFGFFVLLGWWLKRKLVSSEYVLLAGSGFIILILLLILPDALTQYNIDRMFFQLLVIWGLLSVVGGLSIFSIFFQKKDAYIAMTISYIILLLFYNGIIFTLVGGPTFLSLNNAGADYEKFYAQEEEVTAAQWLATHNDSSPIFASSSGYNRLSAHGNILSSQIFITLLPSMIDVNGYVFLTHMNTVAGLSSYLVNNEEYAYNVPTEFFDTYKNQLYDNGVAKIYK
ncbi:MAG: DUF2206 domain-containing protein [Candidatus Yonathbacteria bacterium]|nr:DUF2206 domain-containing protein [Candidatus Yonathbacteria bacterium]NTW47939.1 DUF2206 domain-containing protein [Candidatus Yonathbacteria bacterium]